MFCLTVSVRSVTHNGRLPASTIRVHPLDEIISRCLVPPPVDAILGVVAFVLHPGAGSVREEQVVRRKARALGLGPTHFASASPPSKDRLEAYQSWLDAGMHGEMAWGMAGTSGES